MLIRIKFEGKSRRLSEKVQTVTDLKSKIRELYGKSASSMQIVYKDCDNEEVAVIDDEDLKNCYNEATDLKQSSLTFIVKSKKHASRSQSREEKSRSQERFEGSSSHNHPGKRGPSGSEYSEQSKKAGNTSDAIRGITSGEEITSSLSHLQKECSRVGVTDPISFFADVLFSLEGDCPGLTYNPLLAAATLEGVKADLQTSIKKNYTSVITKKAELLEKNKEFKEKSKQVDEKKPLESEKESYRRGDSGKGPSKMERDEVSDRRGGNLESREREPEYRQPYGKHAQSKYRDGYDQRSSNSNYGFRGGRQNRDQREDDYSRNKYTESDDVLRKLCYSFPRKSKEELRAIISQNPGKQAYQLETLILESRKARSHRY